MKVQDNTKYKLVYSLASSGILVANNIVSNVTQWILIGVSQPYIIFPTVCYINKIKQQFQKLGKKFKN